jgi:hypothetical protein
MFCSPPNFFSSFLPELQTLRLLNGGQEVSILLKYTTTYALDNCGMRRNSHSKLESALEALGKCTPTNLCCSNAVDKAL